MRIMPALDIMKRLLIITPNMLVSSVVKDTHPQIKNVPNQHPWVQKQRVALSGSFFVSLEITNFCDNDKTARLN